MSFGRTSTCDNGVYGGNENPISVCGLNIAVPPNEGNQIYNNNVYDDIEFQQIQTTGAVTRNEQPPKYEESWKPHIVISGGHPPQYFQNFQPQINPILQPIQFSHTQEQQQQRQHVGGDGYKLKYTTLHKIFGVLSLVFGCIIMILDPLIPSIFQYYYSMFPAGLFMLISGICSIHASKNNNKCSLKASLTFDVFALILLSIGYVMGILAAGNPRSSALQCSFTQCLPSINFYMDGIQGFAIFHTVFGIILFVLILWDSTLKCRTLCYKKREPAQP